MCLFNAFYFMAHSPAKERHPQRKYRFRCLPDLNCFPSRIVAGHMFPLPQTDQLLMGSLVVLHRRLWRTDVWIVSMTSVLYIHHCAARMPNMFSTTSEKLIAVYSPPLRGWIQGKVSKDGCVSTSSGPGSSISKCLLPQRAYFVFSTLLGMWFGTQP